MPIAFLGTGLLGSGFVRHLLATTGGITIWNRTARKLAPLVAAGARAAATPAEAAAGATRVHLCVKDDAAVDAILAEVLPVLTPDAVVIDHTTTSVAGSRARAARAAVAGVGFLHAPVFMSPGAAAAAKGIMMCAGAADVFARVDGALAAMTGDLWYVGDDHGRAAAMKLCGNAMIIAITAGMADALAIGRSAGLAGADVLEVMTRLKPGGAIELRGKKMAAGDFAASFELTMARKDLGLMIDEVTPAPLAALAAIAARADALIADGHGADDLGVLALPPPAAP
ncbi:MAG: NAD(P)-dependent oxidoreductase [Myxococcales bacterium]|nr:NAD(P)-dependent oxidoreductase [Myxococcales bacterium]